MSQSDEAPAQTGSTPGPLAQEEWLRDDSPARTWELAGSYAPGGIHHDIWRRNRVFPRCEPCTTVARVLTLLISQLDALELDDRRLEGLERDYGDMHGAEIASARARIATWTVRRRIAVQRHARALVDCRIEHCGMDLGEAVADLSVLVEGVPVPADVSWMGELDDAGDEAAEHFGDTGVELEVTPMSSSGHDPRDEICEPCREFYDTYRDAQRRLSGLDDAHLVGELDAPEELAAAEDAFRRARQRLDVCRDMLCDTPGEEERHRRLSLYVGDGATPEALAPLRPVSDCEACNHIADAIAVHRWSISREAAYAARTQRRANDASGSRRADLEARVRGTMAVLEWHEQNIEFLEELLARCEREMCPDIEGLADMAADAAADIETTAGRTAEDVGSEAEAALVAARAELEADDPSGDDDAEVEPATPAEVAAWRSGERVPPHRRDAARAAGWKGTVFGFGVEPAPDQTMHPDHLRARFAAEDALRAYGFDVEGFLTFLPADCQRDPDPESLEKHRTVLRFPLDQHGRPIDIRQPLWLRRDQVLAGWFVVDLAYHEWEQRDDELDPNSEVRWYSGWSCDIRVWDTRRGSPRLIAAGGHDTDDRATYRTSVLDAIYQSLVSITDGDREIRARHRLARTDDPDPVWDDSTGFVSDGTDADPSGDLPDEPAGASDDGGGSRIKVPIIIGGVVVAIIVVVVAIFALSGSDDDDTAADATATAAPTAAADPTAAASPTATEEPDSTPDPTPEPSDEPDPTPDPTPEPTPAGPDLGPYQEVVASFAGPDGAATFLVIEDDPDEGISFSIVGVDGQPLPASQIDQVWSAIIRLTIERVDRLLNASAFPCGAETGEYRVTCPIGAGPAPEGEFVMVGVELAGPIGEGARRFTYGLAFDDAAEDTDYAAPPEFDADFFDGTEFWYRLEIDENGNRTMRADGFIDGAPDRPRYSAAAAIEFDDTLVWLIPRSELPEGDLSYRATAFHDDGELGAVPDPATSGGDISGAGIDDPLSTIPSDVVDFDADATIPPDVAGTQPRTPFDGDPDEHLTQVLLEEFFTRINDALTSGDRDGVIATVLPQLLEGPKGDLCVAELEASLLQASSVTLNSVPAGPDLSNGFPLYTAQAQINYPTGTVAWPPFLVPGPGGRLYQLIGSCI